MAFKRPIKLPKDTQGVEYYPATTTDAVVHPGLRKSLTDIIDNINAPGESTGSTIEIVNDLTSGGTDKALSAEMGKTLKETIDAIPVINENDFISVETLNDALKDYSKTDHNHDDKYITSSSLESTLSDYSKTNHNHDDKYITSSSLETTLSSYSKTNHNHDDKYMGITTQVNGTVGDVVITNMVPNKLYRYVGGGCTTITVNSLSSVTAGNYNEYMLEFEAGDGCTFVWPETLKWMNGQEPVFESSKIYQISIVNNLGVYAQF
jgi:hypothetical protein